ncbi:polymorphic toxin-type HINT domain-containing protein [Actinomadura terrae]|uniref:polymorphic toxin-type HINT domain-containing protein n=1 Tax=Actinomadura terrae TaxID=604353 RepID=UPI001FA7D56F|nr:polymorphic toxin-type HINT domain-containing protein [Actinomadura terrae]
MIATDEHPFWVADGTGRWVKAADLKPGMWLRTSAGTYTQVNTTTLETVHEQRVHDLTVADHHTYYVLAGSTPVLVHNWNPDRARCLLGCFFRVATARMTLRRTGFR